MFHWSDLLCTVETLCSEWECLWSHIFWLRLWDGRIELINATATQTLLSLFLFLICSVSSLNWRESLMSWELVYELSICNCYTMMSHSLKLKGYFFVEKPLKCWAAWDKVASKDVFVEKKNPFSGDLVKRMLQDMKLTAWSMLYFWMQTWVVHEKLGSAFFLLNI